MGKPRVGVVSRHPINCFNLLCIFRSLLKESIGQAENNYYQGIPDIGWGKTLVVLLKILMPKFCINCSDSVVFDDKNGFLKSLCKNEIWTVVKNMNKSNLRARLKIAKGAAAGDFGICARRSVPSIPHLVFSMGLPNKPTMSSDRTLSLPHFFSNRCSAAHDLDVQLPLAPQQKSERTSLSILDGVVASFGFVPICAYCKNIRNERGAWVTADELIRNRTDVLFTHGICPSCYVELKKTLF